MDVTSSTMPKDEDLNYSNVLNEVYNTEQDNDDNVFGDNYSDMFNSSLTCCDCDTSSEYKKFKAKTKKTLKSIIGYMDDPKHRPCDFKIPDELYKDILEIIKNIFSIKCKVQSLYNTIINPACTNRRNNNNVHVLFRQLRMLLENALQEIERYTDKIIEIANAIIDKYMNRMCLIMRKIEITHCRGLIPIPYILKDMRFVHTLVLLLNEKLKQPGDLSETLSGKEQLFGGACCVDIDENKCPVNDENECSDANELILKKIMNKDFDEDTLDIFLKGNSLLPNYKYCMSLAEQYNILQYMQIEFQNAFININNRTGYQVIQPMAGPLGLRRVVPTLNAVQKRNIVLSQPEVLGTNSTWAEQVYSMLRSVTYRKVRDSLLYSFKKLTKIDKFMTKKMPTTLPCTFFEREQKNEKSLLIYLEMYRFSKYLISVLILRSIVIELKHEPTGTGHPPSFNPPADCKNVKDNIFRNIPNHTACLNAIPENVRYKFMHKIYQDIFGAFANDPRIAAA